MPVNTSGSRKRWDMRRSGLSSGRRHVREKAPDDLVRIDVLGLGVKVQQDPVAQHGSGEGRDILVGDVVTVAREGADLGPEDDELRGAHAGPEVDVLLDELGSAPAVVACG